MTTLYLDVLRHGESESSHLLRGQLDDPLTAQGYQHMDQRLTQYFAQTPCQMMVSSPLQRCHNIAQHYALKMNLPFYVVNELKEISFGAWEGLSVAELYQQHPELLTQFWQTPTQVTPPQGESLIQFARRIKTALEQIAQIAQQHDKQRVCVVTHGGVIKYLHCLAQQRPLDEILTMPAELAEFYHFQYGLDHHVISY